MRVFYILRIIVVLAVAMLVAGARAEAQGFGLGVTNSADFLQVNDSATYTIFVTNLTGTLLPDVLVTNVLPVSAQFVSATQTQGSYTSTGGVTVFDLGPFAYPGIAQMTLVVQMTAVGSITNTVTVVAPNLLVFPASIDVVVQVTNAVPQEADLGVTLAAPAQPTNIVNDPVTYGIGATNLGPGDAPGVRLTNTLPSGVILKSVAPANQSYSVSGSNLIFDLGALTRGAGTNLQITVQPTNAGVFNFSAAIGASGLADTNTANNFASTNITVVNYLSTNLTVSIVSTQKYDPQIGLVEQTVRLSNAGSNAVPAARVLLTGLTNRLFNASGTNNDNPFVVYATTLGPGQGVNLLLQFLAASYFPLTNGQFQAFGVPVPDLAPPAISSTSANLNISRIVRLANGYMLIEFPAITNRAYTVVYSDNVSFSNAAIAPPSIVAVASRLQWIDYGPPTTVSAPTNSGMRFYRVILNP
jgi:uncharacterized repeat protein (TIGR01451 family)